MEDRNPLEYASIRTSRPKKSWIAGHLVIAWVLCLYVAGLLVGWTFWDPLNPLLLLWFLSLSFTSFIWLGLVIGAIRRWWRNESSTAENINMLLAALLYLLLLAGVIFNRNPHPAHYAG